MCLVFLGQLFLKILAIEKNNTGHSGVLYGQFIQVHLGVIYGLSTQT